MNPVLFLDRDGVINKKREDYVKNVGEFEFLPNIFEAIKKINNLGITIIVITNQSIVNRKIISKNQLNEIHDFMQNKMKEKSCSIKKIYFCDEFQKKSFVCTSCTSRGALFSQSYLLIFFCYSLQTFY